MKTITPNHHRETATGTNETGRVGVPLAVPGVSPDTSDVESVSERAETFERATRDARHGRRDAHPTRCIAILLLALCPALHAVEPAKVKVAKVTRADVIRYVSV